MSRSWTLLLILTPLLAWGFTSSADANQAPVATLVYPTDGATLTTPGAIEVRAEASDPDGTVVHVDFLADGELVASTTVSHEPVLWTGLRTGLHELQVVATDDAGLRATSTVARVRVLVRPWSLRVPAGVEGPAAAGGDGTVYAVASDGDLWSISPAGAVRWTYTTAEGARVLAPAIGADGTVYFLTASGRLHAVTSEGTRRWVYDAQPGNSSPAIGRDGRVYFGTDAGRLHAVRPDGTQAWTFTSELGIASTPAVADDNTVYVGAYAGFLHALAPDGTPRWSYPLAAGVNSPMALGTEGTLYVGAANNGDVVAVRRDGTHAWTRTLPDPIGENGACLGLDGTVYVASGQSLFALAPGDGSIRWRFPTQGEIRTTPAVDAAGNIYLNSYDRRVYAVGADGHRVWDVSLPGQPRSAPLLTQHGLLVIADGQELHAIDAGSGPATSAWPQFQRHPQRTGSGLALPVVAITQPVRNARLLAGEPVRLVAEATSPNGAIARVDFLADEQPLGTLTSPPFEFEWTPELPGEPVLAARAVDAVGAVAVSAPVRVRVTATAEAPRIVRHPGSATVTHGAQVVLSADANGAPPLEVGWLRDGVPLEGARFTVLTLTSTSPDDSGRYQLVARNAYGAATSTVALVTVLQPPQPRWRTSIAGSAARPAGVGPGGRLVFAAGNGIIAAHDARGNPLWQRLFPGDLRSGPVIASDGTTLVTAGDGILYALGTDGIVRWSLELGGISAVSPAIGPGDTVYVARIDGTLIAVGRDGVERWRFAAPSEIWSAPAVAQDGTVLVASLGRRLENGTLDGRLHALHPDGKVRWDLPLGDGVSAWPAIRDDGSVLLGTLSGRLMAVTPDGTVLWDHSTAGQFFEGEPVIGPDGGIFVGQVYRDGQGVERGRLLALNPDGRERWRHEVDAAVLGTPAVTADGTVYFTSESQSLWALNRNGTLRFRYPLEMPRGTSPTLGYDGTLYVSGGAFPEVHALLGHSPPAESAWPMARRDFNRTAWAGAPRTAEAWRFPFLANTFDDAVHAMLSVEGHLVVGGAFRIAAGMPARHVARWDGERWWPLGEGFNGPVDALAWFEGQWHAGGRFTASGGSDVRFLARWTGARWEALGDGLNDLVTALQVHDGSLVAAGAFTVAGGIPSQGIARWDGRSWETMGDGLNGAAALASNGAELVAGGGNLSNGASQLGTAAHWDGSRWSALGTPGPDGFVRALAWYQERWVAAGDFPTGITALDGTRWVPVGGGVTGGALPYGFALRAAGSNLWLGGSFETVGTIAARRVARWDGNRWHNLGDGMDLPNATSAPVVRALAFLGEDLIAGGAFLSAGGNPGLHHLARWRGGAWTALAPLPGIGSDGAFEMSLQTDRGPTYGIEVSEDLRSWQRVITFTNLSEPLRFRDTPVPGRGRRFFRAVSP